jgi:TRIAD3 protein (E3 ubiquitin-protein ligase RNF216)
VTNYEHFGEVARGRCPLHENVEDRHEQEVKKAADEAMAKVRAENPHLSDADLMVKVSDKVKQAEDVRRGQAQAQAQAFPYHMVNQQLQQRVPPPAMQLQQPPRRAGPAYPPAPQYVHQPHAFLPAPHIFHHHHMQPVPYQQNPPLPHPYVQFAPYPYNPYYYYYGPPNRHH